MKTESILNANILKITQKIQDEFPELSKYIGEMPLKNSGIDDQVGYIKNLENYYDSLFNLLNKYAMENGTTKNKKVSPEMEKKKDKTKSNVKGYPLYPSNEDIYHKFEELEDLNPEDITKRKSPNEKPDTMNEKDFADDMSGSDLDVPGSELDDQQEKIGSEDEENNYYSLGGDNHNDLEEDNG